MLPLALAISDNESNFDEIKNIPSCAYKCNAQTRVAMRSCPLNIESCVSTIAPPHALLPETILGQDESERICVGGKPHTTEVKHSTGVTILEGDGLVLTPKPNGEIIATVGELEESSVVGEDARISIVKADEEGDESEKTVIEFSNGIGEVAPIAWLSTLVGLASSLVMFFLI
ncbi:hypothetical protein K3495_g8607 [Podosphaera aphanis]|nr:hypothetical protein K3495_g8607 [Podosphaera aphanis]